MSVSRSPRLFAPRRIAGACVAACLAAAASAQPNPDRDTLVLVADHMVAPDGTIVDNQAVYIRNGKIERTADAASVPESANPRRVHGVLSPGLIEAASAVGVMGNNTDRAREIDPSLSVVQALDQTDDRFERSLRAGITSLLITPSERTVCSGRAALVHSFIDNGTIDVVSADGPLVFSIGPAAWDIARGPTSRSEK